MSGEQTFVIVGAGLAGAKAAETLRTTGFSGRIVLAGAEPEPPYERPPLSKEYLLGATERAKLSVHDETWYAENSVELLSGRRVTAVDRTSHEVELDEGGRITYSKLLLTTGSRPRRLSLPGADLAGVYHLRTAMDSDRLREALVRGGRLVVAGAGWIGLEVAAAARQYGCEVTVVEPMPTPLHAALGTEIGGYFAELHRKHGVTIKTGRTVTSIEGTGHIAAVGTDDGEVIAADLLVVGIGARPRDELARQSGLPVENGVVVDKSLRTADVDVFAAGDVANAYHPLYGEHLRVEHWANALHGGAAAAKAMLGEDIVYDRLPYFFTDQYDAGMEFTGVVRPRGFDTLVTRGDPAEGAFHAFWLAGERVVAGMHVNRWDEGIAAVQNMIRGRIAVDPVRLADTSVPLAEQEAA